MIFKRWFKPKWQHKDAAVRQQALQALQPTEGEHKKILHELAFNDGAEAVRKAALHQLNDFALWWQASKHDAAERLKNYAEQQLVEQLIQGQVDTALKQKFIAQCNRSSVLEQLALKEQDPAVRFALLQRLDRSDLIQQSLLDSAFPDTFKQQLLLTISDEKLLEKLSKQLNAELAAGLLERLAAIEELKQKPVRLRKELTLLLAKLNALRERTSLTDIPALQQSLDVQWQAFAAELGCLPEHEAQQYRDKYQQLSLRLTDWLAPKLAEQAQVVAAAAAKAEQEARYQQLLQAITALEQQLLLLMQQNASENALLLQAIKALQEELAQAALSNEQHKQLQRVLQQLQQQCEQLPVVAAQLKNLTETLTQLQQQTLPQEVADLAAAEATLSEFNRNWRMHLAALATTLPAPLLQQQRQLQQQWQNAIRALQDQQQKGLRQIRSKFQQFKRLHTAGRYNVLFGLFKGITEDFQQLPVASQQVLEKELAEIAALHSDIASLQYYIATPRKQALLAEVQALAAVEVTDGKARAEQVKLARANWNSLGKAEPAEDDALNQAFDLACEAAFEPCRQIFARLDAERELHLQQRQQILQELTALTSAELPEKTLEHTFRQLTQRWRDAGAVNRRDYQALQEQFQQVSQQLREQITARQAAHAQAKAAVIAEAQAALALTDATQTAQVLKELQQRWKTLGFAGRRQDQAYWLEFRALCDTFFEQRNAEYKEQQQAELQQRQQVQQALAGYAEQITQASDALSLEQVQQGLHQLALPEGSEAKRQYQQVEGQLQQRLQQLQHQQKHADLKALFQSLAQEDWRLDTVPAAYREAFNQPSPALSRPQLTVALELLSGKESESNAAEKQQVQLALLTLKHNSGQSLSTEHLLQQWLAHGAVAEQEQPLLKRVAALF